MRFRAGLWKPVGRHVHCFPLSDWSSFWCFLFSFLFTVHVWSMQSCLIAFTVLQSQRASNCRGLNLLNVMLWCANRHASASWGSRNCSGVSVVRVSQECTTQSYPPFSLSFSFILVLWSGQITLIPTGGLSLFSVVHLIWRSFRRSLSLFFFLRFRLTYLGTFYISVNWHQNMKQNVIKWGDVASFYMSKLCLFEAQILIYLFVTHLVIWKCHVLTHPLFSYFAKCMVHGAKRLLNSFTRFDKVDRSCDAQTFKFNFKWKPVGGCRSFFWVFLNCGEVNYCSTQATVGQK